MPQDRRPSPRYARSAAAGAIALTTAIGSAVAAAPAPAAATSAGRSAPTGTHRYLLTARTAAALPGLRARAVSAGAVVVAELPDLATTVITATRRTRDVLAADPRAAGVATDGVRTLADAEPPLPLAAAPGLYGARPVPRAALHRSSGADPALSFPGLQWDLRRSGLPSGWAASRGRPGVTAAVADTGLDYTHRELAGRVGAVVDLAAADPTCRNTTGRSDQDLADQYGGPADGDWNGHGSWIGGSIAGALDGVGLSGMAPRASLVGLKISQFCGSTTDATILSAILWAARHRVDVLNISFGGFVDRRDPGGDDTYRAYASAVALARRRGTLVVASAGNDHIRVGSGGRILSHGMITTPGHGALDAFGYYQVPGGVPGVVDVAASGNAVAAPTRRCPDGTTGSATDLNATCKPGSDAHQAPRTGLRDQLAYYSNYGPRVDVAAPGGARKFNLPWWDRGGTPGFPYTAADLTRTWETFGITSNWALQIPCYVFATGSGFPANQCYTALQGTSMAAPHVAATLALTASASPGLQHRPDALVRAVVRHAVRPHNTTTALSATDTSPADLDGTPCAGGFCHLGGAPIPDREAYGAGVVQAPQAGSR